METAIACCRFYYQVYKPHSFTVPSKDESDWELGLPCLFPTIAQRTSYRPGKAQFELKKVLSLNQVAAPAINLLETRGQSFPAAHLTWFIWLDQTIGMKIRSIDVFLKTLQAYGKSKTAIWAELCKRSFSAIIHRCYSMLNKHLLRETHNFFCPPCIFKGRSLFLRLLKLAFFAKRKSQSAFNNFIYSLRFRPKVEDLLETIKFVVAQECCNQNSDFDGPYFQNMMRIHQ